MIFAKRRDHRGNHGSCAGWTWYRRAAQGVKDSHTVAGRNGQQVHDTKAEVAKGYLGADVRNEDERRGEKQIHGWAGEGNEDFISPIVGAFSAVVSAEES